MSTEFKVPELGEGVDTAEVSRIYVSEGDTIEADQNVMELETEKAVADLPCPHAGEIVKVHVSEGDEIKVGQTILTIETGEPAEQKGGEDEAQQDQDGKDQQASEETDDGVDDGHKPGADEPGEEAESNDGKVPETEHEEAADSERKEEHVPSDDEEVEYEEASSDKGEQETSPVQDSPLPAGPATRRLARKLEVDLHDIEGSGASDRITLEDVVEAHDRATGDRRTRTVEEPPLPDFERYGPVERQRLSKIARTALETLQTSWDVVPHVTQHDLADITDLEAARRKYLEGADEDEPRITLTAIVVKAATAVLREFPRFNASLDTEKDEVILKKYWHIGVAVDTESGLLVPVLRDADQKRMIELAAELKDLASRARDRKLKAEEMEGATFTISNQGGIGGTSFTPIVNYPQVAILGMSRARPEVVLIDGRPEERLQLPLSLSYDHRVVNGADAARFLVRLSSELSDYFQLLARI